MKKTYIAPNMVIFRTELQHIICGSITEDSDNLNVNINQDEQFGGGETINSRSGRIWDYDE